MKLNNILVQFIPILLIVFFLLYTRQTVEFSNTVFGKLVAVAIVVFYTKQDIYHGGLICSIIILYYLLVQRDGQSSIYKNKTEGFDGDVHETAKTTFRDAHCVDGKLKYKNMDVRPDYADMVFEELKFTNIPCNPCNKTCSFSIIEEKLKKEDELVRPKDSNEGWLNLSAQTHDEADTQEPVEAGDLFSNSYSVFE